MSKENLFWIVIKENLYKNRSHIHCRQRDTNVVIRVWKRGVKRSGSVLWSMSEVCTSASWFDFLYFSHSRCAEGQYTYGWVYHGGQPGSYRSHLFSYVSLFRLDILFSLYSAPFSICFNQTNTGYSNVNCSSAASFQDNSIKIKKINLLRISLN